MNCNKCHHTDEAHELFEDNKTLLKKGKCQIPNCTCKQFVDSIRKIDEELL